MTKIMVVDDEPALGELLVRFLGKKGYEAVSFTSGKKALAYLKDNPVSLVLTDVNMPEMNGIEVVRLAKQIRPDLPIIVMGSHIGDEEIKSNLFKLGVTDYLSKPFELTFLEKTIELTLLSLPVRHDGVE